jgi:hypothetical protein
MASSRRRALRVAEVEADLLQRGRPGVPRADPALVDQRAPEAHGVLVQAVGNRGPLVVRARVDLRDDAVRAVLVEGALQRGLKGLLVAHGAGVLDAGGPGDALEVRPARRRRRHRAGVAPAVSPRSKPRLVVPHDLDEVRRVDLGDRGQRRQSGQRGSVALHRDDLLVGQREREPEGGRRGVWEVHLIQVEVGVAEREQLVALETDSQHDRLVPPQRIEDPETVDPPHPAGAMARRGGRALRT